jgi:hypothetical protein
MLRPLAARSPGWPLGPGRRRAWSRVRRTGWTAGVLLRSGNARESGIRPPGTGVLWRPRADFRAPCLRPSRRRGPAVGAKAPAAIRWAVLIVAFLGWTIVAGLAGVGRAVAGPHPILRPVTKILPGSIPLRLPVLRRGAISLPRTAAALYRPAVLTTSR